MGEITRQELSSELNDELDSLTSHLAESVYNSNGVHGFNIEEGTWTPFLVGQTTPGTNTYAVQEGTYIKIGKLIVATFYLRLSQKDVNMSGNINISGLPFMVKYGTFYTGILSLYGNLSFISGNTQLLLQCVYPNFVSLINTGADNPLTVYALNSTHIKNNTELQGTIVYVMQ